MVENNAFDAELVALIKPKVLENNLFPEEIRLIRAGKHSILRIVVDLREGTGGVDAERLDRVTREISDLLDSADPIKGEYILEVSTPGAERKLTELRHYRRAMGRLVNFQLRNGEKVLARISAVNDAGVVAVPEVKVPKSNKVILRSPLELKFEEIKNARVAVELKKLDIESDEGE